LLGEAPVLHPSGLGDCLGDPQEWEGLGGPLDWRRSLLPSLRKVCELGVWCRMRAGEEWAEDRGEACAGLEEYDCPLLPRKGECAADHSGAVHRRGSIGKGTRAMLYSVHKSMLYSYPITSQLHIQSPLMQQAAAC